LIVIGATDFGGLAFNANYGSSVMTVKILARRLNFSSVALLAAFLG
jgi:hypothetical protein